MPIGGSRDSSSLSRERERVEPLTYVNGEWKQKGGRRDSSSRENEREREMILLERDKVSVSRPSRHS